MVLRSTPPGLYLDGGDLGEILLPKRYIPHNARVGEPLDVFIYRDSEDRLIATTELPKAVVGDFACLRVVSIHDQVGAFLDWGLPKDLLLPFREQIVPVRVGQMVLVHVYLDEQSQRMVATTRLKRHLNHSPAIYRRGQEVSLIIINRTPMGYNAIVEGAHMGLLFPSPGTRPLRPGERMKGFVRAVHPGGRIDLGQEAIGYKRVAPLTDQVVELLQQNGGRLALDDDSPPEAVRQLLGVSKKAFKQALGALFKSRRIQFTRPGIELLDTSSWSPGEALEPAQD